jgi:hypothetical protein
LVVQPIIKLLRRQRVIVACAKGLRYLGIKLVGAAARIAGQIKIGKAVTVGLGQVLGITAQNMLQQRGSANASFADNGNALRFRTSKGIEDFLRFGSTSKKTIGVGDHAAI